MSKCEKFRKTWAAHSKGEASDEKGKRISGMLRNIEEEKMKNLENW